MTTVSPGTLIDRTFRERIILVGVIFPGLSPEAVDEALDELAQLVDTAGADVVGAWSSGGTRPSRRRSSGGARPRRSPTLSRTLDADTVVFDEELSPAQQRNLEKMFGRTAIDRTAVILDIFAQNARSPEGKAQVELALLRYRLPRLRGRGGALSQQAGGIGTRGPGETQLEVDRRRLVRRMHRLEADLREVDRTPVAAAPRPGPRSPPRARAGRLHQRRQVHPAQPAHRRRGAGREPPLRHPGPPHPAVRPPRR